jgi:carbamoyltransferase
VSPPRPVTLGVHVGHDAAAAIFVDGELRFAEEEERHTRVKAQGGCPWNAIDACLAAVGVSDAQVGTVALAWELERYLACRRELAAHAARVGNPEWVAKREREVAVVEEAVAALRERFPGARLQDHPHHRSHLACAALFAPEARGAVPEGPVLGLATDALGDAESLTVLSAGAEGALLTEPAVLLRRPPGQSIGFFYKRSAEAFGFQGREACGYLMALAGCAPSGDLAERLRTRLLQREGDGDGELGFVPGAFDPFRGHAGTAGRCFRADLVQELGLESDATLEARAPEARAVQELTELMLLDLAGRLVAAHRPRRVLLSGGVTLNCQALGRLAAAHPEVEWVACPVKKDSGAALGAAYLSELARVGPSGVRRPPSGLRLGTEVRDLGTACGEAPGGWRHEPAPDRETLIDWLTEDILEGQLVGLVDGRGEFGPRALGARSLLALPGSPMLAERLNRETKRRHAFQPFAGAFLQEEFTRRIPGALADVHMSWAVPFPPGNEDLAGILHRDGTSRVQLVSPGEDTLLRALLEALAARGEPGVVLNTSLNARGEPVPRTALEALETGERLGLRRLYAPTGRALR